MWFLSMTRDWNGCFHSLGEIPDPRESPSVQDKSYPVETESRATHEPFIFS